MTPHETKTILRPIRIMGLGVVVAIVVWSLGLRALHTHLEAAKNATSDTRH